MEIVLRSVAIFFFLWGLTRAMGKKELSQLAPFELLLLVTIGDLVQQGVTQEDMSVTGAILAVGPIAALILIFSYTGFRWPAARALLEGLPVVIVRDGRLLEEAARCERLTHDEVVEAARERGIGDLREVRLGILEPDGRFSFITGRSEQEHDQPEKTVE